MPEYFTSDDFMDHVIAGIGDMECRIVILERETELSDDVLDLMDKDGFAFYCSPAADSDGRRKVYFVRYKR